MDDEKEEKKETGRDDPPAQPSNSKRKKQANGLAWLIGFMAASNLFFAYNNPDAKVRMITPQQIILSIGLWACSFVPGIRFVSLIIMIPVWFRNFIISGVPMMEKFTKGESIFPQQNNGTDFNLDDILKNYKDDLNPKA